MFGPKKQLNIEDFKRSKFLYRGKIHTEFYYGPYEVFILDQGQAYIRQDMHNLPIVGFYPEIEIYNVDGDDVLIYLQNRIYTYVKPIGVIVSEMRQPFTGFKLGNRYELKNGQIWEQASSNLSNMSSSGHVKILENRIMYVDNWSTSIEVKRVK